MTDVSFTTTIITSGKTATGMVVPPGVVETLGSGRRPAVVVAINDHQYRSTVAVMGGEFMIPLSAENREAAGVAGGDEVDVTLTLDTAPRTVEVPEDLAAALATTPAAGAFFESLSYSNQRRIVLSVTGAKKDDTRQRRIESWVQKLTNGDI